jgi:hypothetical protein
MRFQCPVKGCDQGMEYHQRLCSRCHAKLPEAHQLAIKEASHKRPETELMAVRAAVRWLESNAGAE